ncbi:uncharacterized protein LOC143208958 [Lasioglossum baleicum]|uniref:uncharacterized protein LOC143208958 n=1 Tax=Lasioglossum baleicum TaxID=434251 RepID=UPI003FCC84E3
MKKANTGETSITSEEEFFSDNERTVANVGNEKGSNSTTTAEDSMKMKVAELREKLKEMNVNSTGKKSELQERLKDHIRQEEESESEEPDEYEDNEDDGDNEGDEREQREQREKRDQKPRKPAKKSPITNPSLFTIKDVENAMAYFTGDDKLPIIKWIADFEDLSMLLEWNELQKLIYAKRMLKGSAKQFIAAERGILSWKDLRKRLKDEFVKETNSATIHSRLFRRKRLSHETSRQYVYAMREIASEGDIKDDALIEYIINGIQDSEYNKSILYRSRTLTEIRKNLELYDKMREKSERKTRGKKVETKEKRDAPRKTKIPRCNTCGLPEHDAKNCPDKGKGPKCFKCNNFGHIASKCDGAKNERDNKTVSVNCVTRSKTVYPIEVNDIQCRALIDSGSDISLMKKNQHEQIGSPPLSTTMMSITGAGNATTKVMGSFESTVKIADDTYEIKFFIVPSQSIPHNVILGQDFLEGVEMRLDNGNIVAIRKIPTIADEAQPADSGSSTNTAEADEGNATDITDATFKELREIMCVEVDELNVKEQYKGRIKTLVDEYKLAEKVDTKIETVITLKDSTPVNLRPRRLAPKEKTILDKQIDEWLIREGIIQPSTSEYASPIVIVPKKNGSYRVCIDYRELNKRIKRDHFPMPLIAEKIDELRNARIFSVIDLKNSYLHVPIAKESVKYTAFVTPDAQYEFLKTPFGLSVSATSFLRCIDSIFRNLVQQKIIFTYVDDIIILGSDDEDALEKLTKVLKLAAANRLTISWDKCQFLRTRIEYLGHEIENGNVYSGNAKIKAPKQKYTPTRVKKDSVPCYYPVGEEERLRIIKRILESEKYDDYFVENDILMKYRNGKKLIVVPSCMHLEIIRYAHENGHVVSEKKLGKREGELTPIPKGSRPYDDPDRYMSCRSLPDGFSKFTWLYPTKTTNAKEVINKLDNQQIIFGNPDRIISDRGVAFTCEAIAVALLSDNLSEPLQHIASSFSSAVHQTTETLNVLAVKTIEDFRNVSQVSREADRSAGAIEQTPGCNSLTPRESVPGRLRHPNVRITSTL